MKRALAIALFLGASGAIEASACEVAPPPRSEREARARAVAAYETAEFAYEGVVLGRHDFDRGGRFLVLASYKGPAKPLEVLALPSGNSCYRGVGPAGVWAGSDPAQGIAGLVPRETLRIWREEKLIGGSVISAAAGGALAGTLIVAVLILWRLRRAAGGPGADQPSSARVAASTSA